jgi:hypothetical protein
MSQSGIKSFFSPISSTQYASQVQLTLEQHAVEYEAAQAQQAGNGGAIGHVARGGD